jgi:protein phosphatase
LSSEAVPELAVVIAAASEIGEVREHNEDHYLVGDLDGKQKLELGDQVFNGTGPRGPLLIVNDGMGGVEGGEIAAELAASVMWREMKGTQASTDPEVFARLLRRAARVANHDVHAMSNREPGLRGMGTTVSAAGIVGDRLVVATVGDSRVYVLRAGSLVQVTRDQSLQSALIAAGHSANEAASAGGAILQALGVADDVEPSLSMTQLRAGDRILLCSDGLYGLVGDPAIALLLSEPHDVQQACRLLVAAARAAGGTDNITAIVCKVDGSRLVAPKDDSDLPSFKEFDPQKEGDPALTDTSYVARRLAARVGIPQASIPPSIPVTGQHAVLRSSIGIRLPPTSPPSAEPDEGPARKRLQGGSWLLWLVPIIVVACAIAWWFGAR